MAKFIYVGDPNGAPCATGAITYRNPETSEKVTFPAGAEVECPKWLEARLSKNTHFKQADKK